MEDSKLVYYLKYLSPKQLKAFKGYLSCSMFNRRETSKKLLEVIEKKILRSSSPGTKEAVYRQVFGNKPYNEATLKTSMTQLLKLLRDFLAFIQYQKDIPARNRYFLKAINHMNAQKFFPTYFAQASSALRSSGLYESDYYLEFMWLEEEHQYYRDHRMGREPVDQMDQAQEYFEHGFLLRMLRYHLRMRGRSAIVAGGRTSALMRVVLEYIPNHLGELPPVILAYYRLYESSLHPENLGYFALALNLMSETEASFSLQTREELNIIAMNIGIRQINEGNVSFLNLVFDLYMKVIDANYITSDGKISNRHLLNVVNIGLRANREEEVERFMVKWQNEIENEYKTNTADLCHGLLARHQKDYSQAEKYFNRILNDYNDLLFGLMSRGLLLQIHYETGNMVGVETLSHSYRMFLHRHKKISDVHRRQHLNFLNHFKKMISIPTGDKERLKNLRREILEKDKKGMGSTWLLEKIMELEAVGEYRKP